MRVRGWLHSGGKPRETKTFNYSCGVFGPTEGQNFLQLRKAQFRINFTQKPHRLARLVNPPGKRVTDRSHPKRHRVFRITGNNPGGPVTGFVILAEKQQSESPDSFGKIVFRIDRVVPDRAIYLL